MAISLSPIINADTLNEVLNEPDLLVVDVGSAEDFETGHIPGAVQIDYAAFVTAHPPVMGLVAEADQLSLVFSSIGLTSEKFVIAYDREGGGKAGRLLFTLDAAGHAKGSLLDGGLKAWLAAGHGTESGNASVAHTKYETDLPGDNIADRDYILSKLGQDDVVFLDCRTAAEFSGQDARAARGGHIPGAVNFNWTDAMDPANPPNLRPENELRSAFEALGITPDREIIAYCQTHHRSSHTYIVLKQLGYTNLKGYPGAWSEWGNDPDTPVEV